MKQLVKPQRSPGRRVTVVFNPASGAGRGRRLADRAALRLSDAGHTPTVIESARVYSSDHAEQIFDETELVVVCGGDGTLRGLLEPLSQTATPVYMLPTGNESLFARAFSMSRCTSEMCQAIDGWHVARHYFGRVNGQPFFTMASIGLDSEVVHMLHEDRTGPIGHHGYVMPTVRALFRHRVPILSVSVDGKPAVVRTKGYFIASNTREYALRIHFVPEASSEAPRLYARFLPCRSTLGWFQWIIRARCGLIGNATSAPLLEGEEFSVSVDGGPAVYVQADGDPAGGTPATISSSGEFISVLVQSSKERCS